MISDDVIPEEREQMISVLIIEITLDEGVTLYKRSMPVAQFEYFQDNLHTDSWDWSNGINPTFQELWDLTQEDATTLLEDFNIVYSDYAGILVLDASEL